MSEPVYEVDTYRCRECEALIQPTEDSLCDDCHSGYIDWLMRRDLDRAIEEADERTEQLIRLQQQGMSLFDAMNAMTVAAYGPGHIPGSVSFRRSPSGDLYLHTDGPVDTPF